jgi:hypothetical protein
VGIADFDYTFEKERAMNQAGEKNELDPMNSLSRQGSPSASPNFSGAGQRESVASVMRREARQLRAHAEYLETLAAAAEQLNPRVENAMYEFYMHTKRQNPISRY